MNENLFNEISFINLYSDKNIELVKFYRDLVGLKPQDGQDESSHWYGFQTGATTFAIEPKSNRKNYPFEFNTNNPILIQFRARSLDQLEKMNQQLEKGGVKLIHRSKDMTYGKITNFLDADGNLLEILLEKGSY